MGRATALWFAWPGRGWPASAAEESKFVEDMCAVAKDGINPVVDRDDLTLVLTALRSGISLARLRRFAPGIKAETLLVAYRQLDAARVDAVHAWERIQANPTVQQLLDDGPLAETLLPTVVRRLMEWVDDPHRLRREIEEEADAMTLVHELVYGIEEKLERREGSRRAIGKELLNPIDPGWWDHPNYLPRRVTDLTPNRVRHLLREDVS